MKRGRIGKSKSEKIMLANEEQEPFVFEAYCVAININSNRRVIKLKRERHGAK